MRIHRGQGTIILKGAPFRFVKDAETDVEDLVEFAIFESFEDQSAKSQNRDEETSTDDFLDKNREFDVLQGLLHFGGFEEG